MMKQLWMMVVVVGLTFLSSTAFAKGRHHCVDKDNKEISLAGAKGKARKAACKAGGGKWVKVNTAKAR